MLIEDGTGGGYKAAVNSENKLRTYSVTEPEIVHVSEFEEQSYIWTATADWGADKNSLWIRNDSTTNNLCIYWVAVSPAAACQVEIGVGTGNTSAGTTVTGTNMNRGSGNVALATGKHTNTNCDAMSGLTIIHAFWAGIVNNVINFDGSLLLGYLDEIGIGLITDVGSTTVTVLGYYHD